ncbi:TolC family protein [Flagellimonas aequoris]|uniref:TolC family protein n=1 Tax=Flagellimonas aequoris TaxID=2306997 RepID=A0A418N3X4_9FLAO|nr:TolC family protein [Allomuricauda aequoris]RIV68570.1 TolC family protein [Allomuricauda aequoris]TXK00268.1 TolC family protein [Allomuricauda aequoris]
MKNKVSLLVLLCFMSIVYAQAQNTQQLTLQEAVELALQNSDGAKASEARLNVAESELNVTKNLQYPDLKLSGQYMYLTNADVNLKLATGSSDGEGDSGSSPKVNQLLLGQASASMPLFSGFKLKNTVKSSEHLYQAASFNAKNDNETIALNVIQKYINLYKSRQAVTLIEENLKSAQQRVKDFSAMEQNGLLARNDLLKAQLQESNVEVSLEEAKKNASILNYELATLLKLPEETNIETATTEFGLVSSPTVSIGTDRFDLEALKYQKEAADDQVKVAQSKYYPSLSLSGGYIALDLQNAITVTNAMNVGVGVSYNLSDLFKAKSDIKLAKYKAEELRYNLDAFTDKVKVQVENANQEYELALKTHNMYLKSEEQAEENYRIVKDKYDNGLADTNDLLDADVQQLQARIQLAYAEANITQSYYELLTAKGQLTNTLQN